MGRTGGELDVGGVQQLARRVSTREHSWDNIFNGSVLIVKLATLVSIYTCGTL